MNVTLLIWIVLLVHVHCGVLRRDDKSFIRREFAKQHEKTISLGRNFISALAIILQTSTDLLAAVQQNQTAIMESQAAILRLLADLNQTLLAVHAESQDNGMHYHPHPI